MMMRGLVLAALLLAVPVLAAPKQLGPVFADFGAFAPIASDLVIPKGLQLRHIYDVTAAAKPGQRNDALETAARFINSHVAAGVPEADIALALVVHGPAIQDLLRAQPFAARKAGAANASADAVAALLKHNVRIIVCGQSADAQGIVKADLLPGVEMAISASSAHAVLQAEGYSLNPF